MLEKFKSLWPIIFLIAISLILCIANYSPGTFLSGWDTLHPEFNFGLNFQRTLFGVFRVEQGLGAVAGHSHMSELPRLILLYISSFILPLSFLRYFYIFLNLILGPIGMYFLLRKFFLKEKLSSFLGAAFYLLNLGTLQTFNVPFEMFTTLFASIPFLFYFALAYLEDNKYRTRNLFIFAIISLLNSPSAYASTLWYVFFLCFFVYFLLHFLIGKRDRKSLSHFVILMSVLVFTNLYWIIPSIYFVLNHGKEVTNANINRLFSEQAFLKNKEFGNIKDLLLLKSFYFDWSIYDNKNGVFTDLLLPWLNHLKDIKVLLIGYVIAISTVIGGIFTVKKLKKESLPIISMLLISLFFLINDNFPISFIYRFFQNHVPFFKEALRFPDDKIFNIYAFIGSVFFGFFALLVINYIKEKTKNIKIEFGFVAVLVLLMSYYMLPGFSGNFINKYMRVEIPNEYFNLFSYLNTQPDSVRVANLPAQSPWGWVYYNWYKDKPSYQGAGFLYFGIKQPLLDRDFDRWSPYNESYYREMSYALYSGNKTLLSNVINKYRIGIIIIDKNVSDPQNQKSILHFEESKLLIRSTGLVKDERVFGEIELYRLNVPVDKVFSLDTSTNVFPKTHTTYEDFAYTNYSNYITSPNLNDFSQSYYPFRDLIDNQSKLHNDILKIDSDKITLIPSSSIKNLNSTTLAETINLIPTDLVVQKLNGNIDLSLYPNTPVFDNTPSSIPIKAEVNSASRKNVSVSINQSEFYNLDLISDNIPTVLGKILLKNDINTISFFDSSNKTPIPGGFSALNPVFSSCSSKEPPISGFTENGVKVTGKGDICVVIPYKFLTNYLKNTSTNTLTELKFNVDSNAEISSCLMDLTTLNCLYYTNPKQSGKDTNLSFILSPNQIENTAIRIVIKPKNNNTIVYSFTNASFSYSQAFSEIVLSKSDIANIFTKIPNIAFNKISLSKNVIYDPGFEITKINNFQSDCSSIKSQVKKEVIKVDGKEAIRYYSTTGSYCDHFSYPNLPHDQGYLISINSKNINGLPPTVCISNNKTHKCDIYSDLSPFKIFNTDTFLLPPMNDKGVGYNINFENIGIKGTPSDNLISSIEIIPIPYDFLLNVKSEDTKQTSLIKDATTYKTINPLSFVVNTTGANSILTLNYSYEEGFKAYSISCSNTISCTIKATLAPFYAKELKDHVLVNNWANGWVNNGSKQVAIVFLPQYFEALGLLVILLTFIFITWHHKDNK
jgi:hypothetical protein